MQILAPEISSLGNLTRSLDEARFPSSQCCVVAWKFPIVHLTAMMSWQEPGQFSALHYGLVTQSAL